jgi:hypothetical protein
VMATVVDRLADWFRLSKGERSELAPDNRHSKFYYECQWTLHVLKKSDMIRTVQWGHFQITERGLDAIKNPENFNFDRLSKEADDEDLDESIRTPYRYNLDSIDVSKIGLEFHHWLYSPAGRKHIDSITREKEDVKKWMTTISRLDKKSSEFTDSVLYGLIPHHLTKNAKRVSSFPAAQDIKLKLHSRYRYSDKEFNRVANLIYALLEGFQMASGSLKDLIRQFKSDTKYSKGFQSGMLSPLIFCLNDSFPVITEKTTRTYRTLAPTLNLNVKTVESRLRYYPDMVDAVSEFVKSLGIPDLKDQTIFAAFCWWFATEYRETLDTQRGFQQGVVQHVNYPEFFNTLDVSMFSKKERHDFDTPKRVRIRHILEHCQSCEWVIPDFQRYFDWGRNNIRDFLESIFSDFYVGSLLLWDVSKEKSLPIGVIPVKGVDGRSKKGAEAIILDGQQRITSLYYAIRAPEFQLKDSKRNLYFYVNFLEFFKPSKDGELILVLAEKVSPQESYERLIFPLHSLENLSAWINGFEDYMDVVYPDDPLKKKKGLRRKIEDKLNYFLDGYEIPYIVLPRTMGLLQVTEIFERINTTGKALSIFDLLIARLSRHEIRLKDLWDESAKEHPKLQEYQEVTEFKMPVYIFYSMALSYSASHSCKKSDLLNIWENVFDGTGRNFEATWETTCKNIEAAIARLEGLREGFGVKDKKIPFAPMIPILASLLEYMEKNNKRSQYEKIRIWYWSCIVSEAYSSSVETQLATDYREMMGWFANDSVTPKVVEKARMMVDDLPLLDAQTKSGAIYNGVLSLLALEGAKDLDTKEPLEHSSSNHEDHLFPKSKFPAGSHVNSILNKTWMSAVTNQKMKRAKMPSVFLKELLTEKYAQSESELLNVLSTHFIDRQGYELMLNDDLKGFLAARSEVILRKMKNIIDPKGKTIRRSLIEPRKDYENRMAIIKTIESCDKFVHWVDRYFKPESLEWLRVGLDRKKVKNVKILTSLDSVPYLSPDLFKTFAKFLQPEVHCELRFMKGEVRKEMHDRWILSASNSYNIPSTDTIARGQWSEIKTTENTLPFSDWWEASLDIVKDWQKIKQSWDDLQERRQSQIR